MVARKLAEQAAELEGLKEELQLQGLKSGCLRAISEVDMHLVGT